MKVITATIKSINELREISVETEEGDLCIKGKNKKGNERLYLMETEDFLTPDRRIVLHKYEGEYFIPTELYDFMAIVPKKAIQYLDKNSKTTITPQDEQEFWYGSTEFYGEEELGYVMEGFSWEMIDCLRHESEKDD